MKNPDEAWWASILDEEEARHRKTLEDWCHECDRSPWDCSCDWQAEVRAEYLFAVGAP